MTRDFNSSIGDSATFSPNHTRISLIGYRGTGKSTIARLLADRLGWSWVDSDVEIERRAGKSIKEIFAAGGEAAFRDLETIVVREVMSRERTVVALGGGAILREENRRALRGCITIWLTADPKTICDRVSCDPTTVERRPNLTVSGGMAEIEQLLAVREPLYRECAVYTVDTVGKTPDQVVGEIVCFLERR